MNNVYIGVQVQICKINVAGLNRIYLFVYVFITNNILPVPGFHLCLVYSGSDKGCHVIYENYSEDLVSFETVSDAFRKTLSFIFYIYTLY